MMARLWLWAFRAWDAISYLWKRFEPSQRCGCGQYLLRGGTMELGGVKHRIGKPCYRCDDYGRPV